MNVLTRVLTTSREDIRIREDLSPWNPGLTFKIKPISSVPGARVITTSAALPLAATQLNLGLWLVERKTVGQWKRPGNLASHSLWKFDDENLRALLIKHNWINASRWNDACIFDKGFRGETIERRGTKVENTVWYFGGLSFFFQKRPSRGTHKGDKYTNLEDGIFLAVIAVINNVIIYASRD